MIVSSSFATCKDATDGPGHKPSKLVAALFPRVTCPDIPENTSSSKVFPVCCRGKTSYHKGRELTQNWRFDEPTELH